MLLVQKITRHEVLLLVYFIIVVVTLAVLFIIFFYTFQRLKNKFLIEKEVAQKEYESMLMQAENEIQKTTSTLKKIRIELYDNVEQLLSVAKKQLQSGLFSLPEDKKEALNDALETVDISLAEVRQLSKIVNDEVLINMDLHKSIQVEVDYINRFSHTDASLEVMGDPIFVEEKEKIIIFRIVQECCSNVIKHAEAAHLNITITYKKQHLLIQIKDDGIGYNMNNKKIGSGLINMRRRAEMIQAQLKAFSKPEQGTEITLTYQPPLDETAQSSNS